jgi:putative ABC transport system ATP-binding protein
MITLTQEEGDNASLGVTACVELLQRILIDTGASTDRALARRAVQEASETWVGSGRERWWKWLSEAGTSLGLKCKVIDCTFTQSVDMARVGAKVVFYSEEERPRWWAVTEALGNRLHVIEGISGAQGQWCSKADLRNLLGDPSETATIRCVLIENEPTILPTGEQGPGPMSPQKRFIEILRGEWNDIWIILTFALVTGVLSLASPIAVEALVNTVAFGRYLQPIIILALILLGFLAFSAALRGLQTYVVEIIQQRLFARVAGDLAYRLPHAQLEALDKYYPPELVNRFFDVVTTQKVAAHILLDGISLVVTVLVGMAVLAFYHPWLLGYDVLLLILIVIIVFVLGRGAVQTSIKESKQKYYVAAWLEDLARCPVAFRTEGGAEFALDRADWLTHDYIMARKKHFRILIRQILFALGLQAVASTLLLGLGGWLVVSGQLTLGQLVAAELIVTMIVGGFAKMDKHLEGFYDVMASMDKLGTLFDIPIEQTGGLVHWPEQRDDRAPTIRLHAVSYSYPKGKKVLDGVTFTVGSGDIVGINGATCSGKSTLLELIYGLRTPTFGHLTIDGIDPRDFRPDVLRQRVALVRDIETFHGTISENVDLQRPDVSASDIHHSLHFVGLLDEILTLPEGLDTHINSNGRPLTENQCRRLMLARALAGRPRILMLDGLLDPLSDPELESLLPALCDPSLNCTMLIVSGRHRVLDRCHRVIPLQPLSSHDRGHSSYK